MPVTPFHLGPALAAAAEDIHVGTIAAPTPLRAAVDWVRSREGA
jgi:hypothetical protein